MKYVSYDKASKSEQQRRDNMKRSSVDIPSNKTHKSGKDYDRSDERRIIDQEMEGINISNE